MSAGAERVDVLRRELDAELSKRDRIRQRQMAAYANGSATRRRTTTGNANADWCNERIISLRAQIKAIESESQEVQP